MGPDSLGLYAVCVRQDLPPWYAHTACSTGAATRYACFVPSPAWCPPGSRLSSLRTRQRRTARPAARARTPRPQRATPLSHRRLPAVSRGIPQPPDRLPGGRPSLPWLWTAIPKVN